MIARESKFAILFRHWIKANPMYSCTIETKQTTTESIAFNKVKQAQIDYGMAIKSKKGVLMRVQAVAEGMPDYVWCRQMPAYIAIKFPKFFCLIDVETFAMEQKRSERKSLTSSRAKEIAITVVDLSRLSKLSAKFPTQR